MDRRVCVLGSTGSIGRQTLDVISELGGLGVCGLAARSSHKLIADQAQRHNVPMLAVRDPLAAAELRRRLPQAQVFEGGNSMSELVRAARPDIVITGVVGAQGLSPTLAAIENGAALGIANKETLVMAGAIVMPAAKARGVPVLPVDSEHSAVFQCLQAGRREEVRRIVLTASGGALRDWEPHRVESATVEQALAHPTWRMGPKITVDSATLMNKALEIVEAHWLFELPSDRIDVVIHPESIVHGWVEFHDGSIVAQMARADMTLPIAYALCYPRRPQRPSARAADLPELGKLTFRKPSPRFERALELGRRAVSRGGTAGAVLNAANEAAVEAFLAGRITFGRIVPLVEEVLNRAPDNGEVTLEALTAADAWARRQVASSLS
jgi:1-deoxy-D-xylulose-5-phosphate reductoisomerase